jgi:hypothetical protein
MNAGELVADKEVFSFLSGQCGKIFDTSKRLPDFVFRHCFSKYFAIEYGHIYGKSFGSFLFQMSTIFDDESANYMALDPHPDSYYQNSSHLAQLLLGLLV